MITSQVGSSKAWRRPPASSTRWEKTSNPACISRRSMMPASLSESSICKSRKDLLIVPHSLWIKHKCPIITAISRSFSRENPSVNADILSLHLGRLLIQDQPIQSQLRHRLDKMFKFHRLADIAVDPQVVTGGHVLFLPGRRENDHGHAVGARLRANSPQ